MHTLRTALPLASVAAMGVWLASEIFDFRSTLSNTLPPADTALPLPAPSKPEINLDRVAQLFPQPAAPVRKDPKSILKDIRILGRIVARDEKASKLIFEAGGKLRTIKTGEHLTPALTLNHITPHYFTLVDSTQEFIIEFKPTLHILTQNRLTL